MIVNYLQHCWKCAALATHAIGDSRIRGKCQLKICGKCQLKEKYRMWGQARWLLADAGLCATATAAVSLYSVSRFEFMVINIVLFVIVLCFNISQRDDLKNYNNDLIAYTSAVEFAVSDSVNDLRRTRETLNGLQKDYKDFKAVAVKYVDAFNPTDDEFYRISGKHVSRICTTLGMGRKVCDSLTHDRKIAFIRSVQRNLKC
jgi:hypothetical protein